MRLICVLSIVFALGATPAFADYEPVHLPKCTLHVTSSGEEFCGYNLDEWKLVLSVDAKLVTTEGRLKKEIERTTLLAQQVNDLKDQVSMYAKSQKLLIDRSDKLTNELIDLDLKYQNERVKPRWGSPLAWTAAAISTSVLAGFVVSSVIN